MNTFIKLMSATGLVVALCGAAKADVTWNPKDFEALRASFTSEIPTHESKFERASKMQFVDVTLKRTISQTQCKAIQKQIEKNYPFSPFKFNFDNGDTSFPLCGPDKKPSYAKDDVYFGAVSEKNQFGLPIAYALQFETHDFAHLFHTLYLDAKFRMVEHAWIENVGEVAVFNVQSLDSQGNYYFNAYNTQNSLKPWYISYQAFVSADGSFPTSWRITRHRNNQKGPEIVTSTVYRRATKDWDKFNLALTYAFPTGGFYSYGKSLEWSAHQNEELEIDTVEGKEVCATGFKRSNELYLYFLGPASQNDVGGCSNNW